ncbi:MAG: flavin reductase family protein [Magnetococcales bacterium]|nr:flavin reductase family protein [Magnetococcales bacterium]MBF0156995.1 flavin reductase family protein [Magnetococcales bacterium]
MEIGLAGLSPDGAYFILTQALIPRPIAWVLSENPGGSLNLAPFSWFNAVCADPPLVLLSISRRRDGSPKDTWSNISARGDFVVHIPHVAQAGAVNESSASLPPGVSEVDHLGLATVPFAGSRLPRLADCRLAMACVRHDILTVGHSGQSLILGEVKSLFVDDDAVVLDAKGRVRILAEGLEPLGRLGVGEYVAFGEKLKLPPVP